MKVMRGYYSLVQYCPDMSRLETANVGVILLCPEAGFADLKLSRRDARARVLFRSTRTDSDRLAACKAALEDRLRIQPDAFRTSDALAALARTRGNDLILTVPRPVKVSDPPADLDRLFAELVD